MHSRLLSKFQSLPAFLVVLWTTCISTALAPAAARNAVVILVDDLGWRDLSCMGSPVYETPHIDALAASGMLFTDGYAPSSICSPSRAGILTGSQPSRHGVYTVVKNRGKEAEWKVVPKQNRKFLPKDYPTIGTVLSDAGIANGTIGKWHVAVSSPSHGFAEGKWGGYLGLPINYFAPFKLGFLPKDVPEGAYLPAFIRDAGTDFLERHKDERFFLYFSTYLPHDEINNEGEDPDAEGMFRLAAPEPVVEKYRKKIAAMQRAGEDLQGHDNPVYAAMIEETDRSVGAIIDKLDELELREKTLVLFISDNGGLSKYTSNRPLRGEKTTLYEGGIRVPVIASMPGEIVAGRISHEPISGIDFYPTLCTFFGVKPSDPAKVDGEDLSKLLFDGKPLGERNLFWNFPSYNDPQVPARGPRSALRRGDWKLIHRYEDDGYELYNLNTDIGETTDLSAGRPEILQNMRQHLEASYQRFGAAASLPPNPAYRAD
nr:sulfatase [Coraliomargarita sinensis]